MSQDNKQNDKKFTCSKCGNEFNLNFNNICASCGEVYKQEDDFDKFIKTEHTVEDALEKAFGPNHKHKTLSSPDDFDSFPKQVYEIIKGMFQAFSESITELFKKKK